MRRGPHVFPFLIGLLLWHAHPSLAQERCEVWAARLASLQGQVDVKTATRTGWQPLQREGVLCPGDSVRVGANSRAALVLPSETILRLDQRTTVTFPEAKDEETSFLDLVEGLGYFMSRVPRMLKVRTPFVNAAVEGTEFVVAATGEAARVLVFEGSVSADNAAGRLRITSGEGAVAARGAAPTRIVVVEPRDAVKWALYYPPVVDHPLEDAPAGVHAAVASFNRGDIAGALAALEHVPAESRDAEFYDFRASMLLQVGRVEAALASAPIGSVVCRAQEEGDHDGGRYG